MKNNYFKWIIFLALTPLQFYVAMLLGIIAIGFIGQLCPTDLSHIAAENPFTCSEQPPLSTIIIAIFASLAAVLVVLVGTVTCPIKSKRVPFIIYSLGAIVALIMAVSFAVSMGVHKYFIEISIEVISALFFGFITSLIMSKRV